MKTLLLQWLKTVYRPNACEDSNEKRRRNDDLELEEMECPSRKRRKLNDGCSDRAKVTQKPQDFMMILNGPNGSGIPHAFRVLLEQIRSCVADVDVHNFEWYSVLSVRPEEAAKALADLSRDALNVVVVECNVEDAPLVYDRWRYSVDSMTRGSYVLLLGSYGTDAERQIMDQSMRVPDNAVQYDVPHWSFENEILPFVSDFWATIYLPCTSKQDPNMYQPYEWFQTEYVKVKAAPLAKLDVRQYNPCLKSLTDGYLQSNGLTSWERVDENHFYAHLVGVSSSVGKLVYSALLTMTEHVQEARSNEKLKFCIYFKRQEKGSAPTCFLRTWRVITTSTSISNKLDTVTIGTVTS